MTNAQSDQAVKNPGVKGVGVNGPTISTSLTSPAAVLSPSKAKRDISYIPQKDVLRYTSH